MEIELPSLLKQMYASGFVIDRKQNRRKATDSTISEAEAKMLMKIVTDCEAVTTLETGLAFGASALAVCKAKEKMNSKETVHYGVDPNQRDYFEEAALVSLEKEGLINKFKLLEGPSHLVISDLIKSNVKLDFAFIDGWHTFDYTLIDFFLVDKLLRPGGFIAFHDMQALSKQKVLKFILTHRKYKVEKKYAVRGNEPRLSTVKFFLWRLIANPRLLFSWFHWNYQFYNSSGLIVLRKEQDFEPNFDFYKSF